MNCRLKHIDYFLERIYIDNMNSKDTSDWYIRTNDSSSISFPIKKLRFIARVYTEVLFNPLKEEAYLFDAKSNTTWSFIKCWLL